MEKITRDRGFQCASYKDKCLRRRIAVRMRARGLVNCDAYAACLDSDAREYDRLMRSLTINVTRFFRNWETFSVLEQRVIPELFNRGESEIRAWSAGCSSGEEAYSLAILMHQHAEMKDKRDKLGSVKVLGTDIDEDCLGEAERAFYSEGAVADTPMAIREKYLPEVLGLRNVVPEVRNMVTFERHDMLASAPPIANAHLVVCRNVIIYFEREAQDRLFEQFHASLAPDGYLVLGKVETLLGTARSMFKPVNARERVFQKA